MLGEQRFSDGEGFYILCMQMKDCSEVDIRAALETLWSLPESEGCYLDSGRNVGTQLRVKPSWNEQDGPDRLCGNVRLPGGQRVAAATLVTEWISGIDPSEELRNKPRTIEMLIPMWELRRLIPRPGGEADPAHSEAWQRQLEGWLAQVAQVVFDRVAFSSGCIGQDMSERSRRDDRQHGIPSVRTFAYLRSIEGRLDYFPTTAWPNWNA